MSIRISQTAVWESSDKHAYVKVKFMNRGLDGRCRYSYKIVHGFDVIHEDDDLLSGVDDPVNVGAMLITLSRFMDAWSEALGQIPPSENIDLFPQTEVMIAWVEKYGEDFSMDCIELDETERAGE